MALDLGTLFLIGIAYLCLLFAIAWATDRGHIPQSLASHPLVYTLSLGIFGGAWAIFGIIGVASHFGYGYLGYFVGAGVLFLFAPLLLLPLWRICRQYQLTSLPDLLAFRYRGAPVGAITTLGLLVAALPLLIAQIEIIAGIATLLGGEETAGHSAQSLGLVFACAIALFAIIFGVRPISERERHNGLVVAMAFESLVKLGCFLALGALALRQLSADGGLPEWLRMQPDLLQALHGSMRSSSAHMLTLVFFAAVIGLPDLFHMVLYENPSQRATVRASWGFPLYLLLLSLPVLPVLWAGEKAGINVHPHFFAGLIGLGTDEPAVALLAFICAISASSSMIAVTTLALASMTANNLVLPFYRPGDTNDLYRGLALTRSVLTAVIILGAYAASVTLQGEHSIEKLGFTAFIAAAQFFPGTLALLYWTGANRNGLLGGLVVGFGVWLLMVLEPSEGSRLAALQSSLPFGIPDNPWATTAANSITLNALTLIALSYLTRQSREEREAAASCSLDNLSGAGRHQLLARSPAEFIAGLTATLGAESARRQVESALSDLGYAETETRPYAMRRLRDRIGANLSRLMGASVAMELVNRSLPYEQDTRPAADDIALVESRLDDYQRYLTGFTAELDGLRRFYRDTLQELPLGVCGINTSNEIVMWNHALERITGIATAAVLGSTLERLPAPWGLLIRGFADSSVSHVHHYRVIAGDEELWISLHKTLGGSQDSHGTDARFLLLEDVTETQRLQEELVHTERLASIGRLAAGVAHEIGNPVTGIDFLAQNLVAESGDDGTRDSARLILEQTQRISHIVQALIGFAHSGANSAAAPVPVAVAQCVDEAIYLLGLDRSAQPVEYRNLCPPQCRVRGDGQRLLQVFINLLSNARAASDTGGLISVECDTYGRDALISVTDEGCGIPPGQLEQVFEPFFTTKPPGEGTGLGLSLVYSIVRDMGGSVSIQSPADPASGRGTRVLISLPAAD